MIIGQIALLGALAISLVNIIAAIYGFGIWVDYFLDFAFLHYIATPIAIAAFCLLIFSWIGSFFSGIAGAVLFWGNFVLAPIAYQTWGLPTFLAWSMGLMPVIWYVVFFTLEGFIYKDKQ